MKLKTDKYIFPPRATHAIPRNETAFLQELKWLAQLKFNDTRTIVKFCPNGHLELWNRHAERMRSYTPPDMLLEQLRTLQQKLGIKNDKITMLDGGLLDQKHPLISDTIVLWDVLSINDNYLIGESYINRYSILREVANGPWTHEVPTIGQVEFGIKLTENVLMPDNYEADQWDALWDLIERVNAPFTRGKPSDPNFKISPVLEGLVFKDPEGELKFGFREKNNDDWQMRSRIHTGRHRF